jgi:imidazoleglycerol phosphate dehydratase HisB
MNDAQSRVANAATALMTKANARFAQATRRLLQNNNNLDRFTLSAIAMNDASSRVANAHSDLASRANSRFNHATRHLLKEGDMNAAAEKIARAQYDLNAENIAR